MTDTYNRLTKNHEKPFVMSGGTYARKLPRAFACGTGMPLPPTPEGLFKKGHGDYHQPDEAISLKRVEMATCDYIKGILEIAGKCHYDIYIEKNTKIPPLQVSGEVFVFLNTFFTDAAAASFAPCAVFLAIAITSLCNSHFFRKSIASL